MNIAEMLKKKRQSQQQSTSQSGIKTTGGAQQQQGGGSITGTQDSKKSPVISFDRLRKKSSLENIQKQKRIEDEKKLKMLLKNALFLKEDEDRRERWIKSISNLPDKLLHNLIGAVIRENFRYKKGTRNLVEELDNKNETQHNSNTPIQVQV